MKNGIVVFLVCFVLACEARTVNPPPQGLLSEETMENMLYDLALLNALQASFLVQEGQAIFDGKYMEKKYQVPDSIWTASKKYYAQDPQRMAKIYKRINTRLNKAKDSIEVLKKLQKKRLPKKKKEKAAEEKVAAEKISEDQSKKETN